jgi:hypothetical protein
LIFFFLIELESDDYYGRIDKFIGEIIKFREMEFWWGFKNKLVGEIFYKDGAILIIFDLALETFDEKNRDFR